MFGRRLGATVLALALFLAGATVEGWGRTKEPLGAGRVPKAEPAAVSAELRVHNVGKFWLAVSNFGMFGSESETKLDPCTRLAAPSAEFPAGTGVNYLFQGALWIGAILGEGTTAETLVSVGADGWQRVNEMTAAEPFVSRTSRSAGIQQSSCFIPYSPDAVSEQDHIAVYTDTSTDPSVVQPDPFDGPFKPMGIRITQKSYAWSYDYAEDFVLFDYVIENISARKLNNVYMALYIDADNHNSTFDAQGFTDDVSGFKLAVPSFISPLFLDTLNLAWTGDNDGLSSCVCPDNQQGVFVPTYSPTSLAGTRVVKSPGNLQFSFNWWISNGDNVALDWGPWRTSTLVRRPGLFRGVFGTPEMNTNKYFIMSNGEFDYDQLKVALPVWVDSGWVPIPTADLATDIADGYDTRYLLSFGPLNIVPGAAESLTLAYIAGEDFHVRPQDWQVVKGHHSEIGPVTTYCDSLLDFTDFATNARWAGWVYDNPGVDTDNDGDSGLYRIFEGQQVYYQGDGVPDFIGPPPPNPPVLEFVTKEGSVVVKWNGYDTETGLDYFSNEADFEGYRIYLSRSGFANDYALLDSYDKDDLKMFVYNPGSQKWALKVASLTADSIVKLFEHDNSCCYLDFDGSCNCISGCTDPNAFGSDPLVYTRAFPYTYIGSCGAKLQVTEAVAIDTGQKVYFEKQDWNQDLNAIKVYKNEIELGQITPDSIDKYYQYEYTIDSLSPSAPVYIAVTAFDYGNPQTNLSPLETSVLVNSRQVWPLASPQGITTEKIVVFPNPYKITESYVGEDRNLPRGKKLHFVQLPGVCTIRIYTLDGDKVAEIKNDNPSNSEISWNLISTNEQEVVAGVYIYQVESARGNQVGKFVLVK